MRNFLVCAFVLLFIVLNSQAQVKIEDLLSVPFPTELTSSKDGKQMAWVLNNQGVRNLFTGTSASQSIKSLTHHVADDGIEITEVSFSPDGKRIVFVEGNGNNNAGEAANPALVQRTTGTNIWLADIGGDSMMNLGKGRAPLFAPDGQAIVFNRNNEIWIQRLDSITPAEKLLVARGSLSHLVYSPDKKNLAFVSSRGDHAFIGIYNLAAKSLTYPDPSFDIDDAPVWSPDAKQIAFIRVPSIKDRLPFTESREANPWSIRLVTLDNGDAKELWKAAKGNGSVLFKEFPVADNLLLWAAGNQIIFPYEKDGWQHLYALHISDGHIRLLTPGDGEVESMLLNADKTAVIYNGNIGDSHHRHVQSVNVNDGKIRSITSGNGIEWSPVSVDSGLVVFRSTATTPGWPTLIRADGSMKQLAAELFPVNFPASSLVIPKDVSFRAKDGILVHGQLFLPPGYQAGKKYPALIFFHGGSRRQMLLGYHYMDYYSNDYSMNQFNALNGYIVLAVNYRSGIGYGLNFREALHYGANGGSEYNDVLAAGLFIKSRPDIDTKRIGIWGGSYGGYLTAMGLARNSDIFSCGVDIHGVHDWSDEMKTWVADYDPSVRAAFAKTAIASSPISFLNGWKSPVLFIHGDDDRNVPFSQSVNLIEKLRARNVYFEQLVLPDEVHSFLLHSNWLKAYHASSRFFSEKMK